MHTSEIFLVGHGVRSCSSSPAAGDRFVYCLFEPMVAAAYTRSESLAMDCALMCARAGRHSRLLAGAQATAMRKSAN